jgi:hypothetical protein
MRYILFYSNACQHSRDVMSALSNCAPLAQQMNYFCVDGESVLPSYVHSTPTLRVVEPGKSYVLVGESIFHLIAGQTSAVDSPVPVTQPTPDVMTEAGDLVSMNDQSGLDLLSCMPSEPNATVD